MIRKCSVTGFNICGIYITPPKSNAEFTWPPQIQYAICMLPPPPPPPQHFSTLP